jgi:jasmonate ZIM domain-containing protein
MERDFLGLSSREPLAVVKEEVNADGCKESGIFFFFFFLH